MYRTNINRFTTFIVHSSLREDISETAVDAGHGFTIVQVDVDSGVAESSTTSVTGDLKRTVRRGERRILDLPLAC